jgi:hypothetical protein
MYGDQFVRDYVDLTSGQTDWKERFNRYDVKAAIVTPTSGLRFQLQQSPDWQERYRDEMALVFTRR